MLNEMVVCRNVWGLLYHLCWFGSSKKHNFKNSSHLRKQFCLELWWFSVTYGLLQKIPLNKSLVSEHGMQTIIMKNILFFKKSSESFKVLE